MSQLLVKPYEVRVCLWFVALSFLSVLHRHRDAQTAGHVLTM